MSRVSGAMLVHGGANLKRCVQGSLQKSWECRIILSRLFWKCVKFIFGCCHPGFQRESLNLPNNCCQTSQDSKEQNCEHFMLMSDDVSVAV